MEVGARSIFSDLSALALEKEVHPRPGSCRAVHWWENLDLRCEPVIDPLRFSLQWLDRLPELGSLKGSTSQQHGALLGRNVMTEYKRMEGNPGLFHHDSLTSHSSPCQHSLLCPCPSSGVQLILSSHSHPPLLRTALLKSEKQLHQTNFFFFLDSTSQRPFSRTRTTSSPREPRAFRISAHAQPLASAQ
ncbi:hypothetical protein BJY00DRAFT_255663 [Aspergillus carlsbadensis]|nr:hypothetical protein BJY00DRAFT_255663 [Aspergillus carlsbadensis]